jgi:hypothetical protein
MLAGATEEGLIPLLVIEHEDLPAPVRLSGDRVDTVSRGQVYTAMPFELRLPDDIEGQARSAEITIVDVSREITAWLRQARSAPEVTIELVRLADPDSLEVSISGLRLQGPRWQPPEPVITAELVGGLAGDRRYPAGRFVPSRFPGLS